AALLQDDDVPAALSEHVGSRTAACTTSNDDRVELIEFHNESFDRKPCVPPSSTPGHGVPGFFSELSWTACLASSGMSVADSTCSGSLVAVAMFPESFGLQRIDADRSSGCCGPALIGAFCPR